METGAPTPAAVGASSRARPLSVASAAGTVVVAPPPAPALAGPWQARPVRAEGPELARVQRWMAEPHVAAHWHQAWDLPTWSAEVGRQLAGDHSRPWTVWLDGEPVAYLEVYRVALDVVGRHVEASPDDLGVHLALGDVGRTGRGLGRRVLTAVADGLFAADPRCGRVWGDPEAGHRVARRAFAAAGFAAHAEVDLGHKRAALVVRHRTVPPSNASC